MTRSFLLFLLMLISTLSAQTRIDGNDMWRRMKEVDGVTYKWAGTTKEGFDCSGFIYYIFNAYHIDTGHSSRVLGSLGSEVPMDQARFGDIIVFTGTDSSVRQPGHAGIVISAPGQPLTFMHSSSSKSHYGVTTTVYPESNYPKRFLCVRRIAAVSEPAQR